MGDGYKDAYNDIYGSDDDDCEDQAITPMPESCTRWGCASAKEKGQAKLVCKGGFMICPNCGYSYGAKK